MTSYIFEKDILSKQSHVNMAGLKNRAEDYSLEKEAVTVDIGDDSLSKELKSNAFKWCRRCLGGPWTEIEEKDFKIEHVR